MSTDEKVAKDLVQTLKDGRNGFTVAAERLRDGDHAPWAAVLERYSQQRAEFADQIVALGHEYGDDVEASGSLAARLHRGWISLKDAVTGDQDADAVLGAVVTGENHAVSEYAKALEADLSAGFRTMVLEQHRGIVAARDEIKALQTQS